MSVCSQLLIKNILCLQSPKTVPVAGADWWREGALQRHYSKKEQQKLGGDLKNSSRRFSTNLPPPNLPPSTNYPPKNAYKSFEAMIEISLLIVLSVDKNRGRDKF